MFHGDTVVALNTWTFSYRCAGPNLEYRVDSTAAQTFLATYLYPTERAGRQIQPCLDGGLCVN